jgi:lipopolysaccharide export system permease protein
MNALVTRSWSALRQWLPRRASWPRRLALPHWSQAPLLDRWLLSELIGPLLFGIAAFTAVSLSVGVVFELVRRVAEAGLPLLAAVQVLMLRLPGFLVLAFPMATLMATLLAYSRLSGSSELTALRSVGVSTRPWCCRPSPWPWR